MSLHPALQAGTDKAINARHKGPELLSIAQACFASPQILWKNPVKYYHYLILPKVDFYTDT